MAPTPGTGIAIDVVTGAPAAARSDDEAIDYFTSCRLEAGGAYEKPAQVSGQGALRDNGLAAALHSSGSSDTEETPQTHIEGPQRMASIFGAADGQRSSLSASLQSLPSCDSTSSCAQQPVWVVCFM